MFCRSNDLSPTSRPFDNALLRLMPPREKQVLLDLGDEVAIRPRQVLHHWGLPMEHVYFLRSGLVSVSAKINDGRFLEVWLIGSEGLVGAPLALAEDDNRTPHRRVVQVGGSALRVPAGEFCAALAELPNLRKLVLRYINVVLLQTSQSGACNTAHSLMQRLARWLLIARNALESDWLPLTHEVLGHLLGVRRAGVSECLEYLQGRQIVNNSRGMIEIGNVPQLEEICCGCFKLIHREYHRQLRPEASRSGDGDAAYPPAQST